MLTDIKDIVEYIFFSGITFFTIGYSDILKETVSTIEPIRKILDLIEAGIGIILTSTILISFMNKYLSHK
ncbi:MAG: ion channel [Smithella sp.]